MLPLWSTWFAAARFGIETQQVIALRLMRMAAGGPLAATEAQRMVVEKLAAMTQAQQAAALALMTGKTLPTAAAKALLPIRRTLRANRRRLSR